MVIENSNALIDIFSNADLFMLIFIRMLGFSVIMPILGGSQLFIVKIGFSLALAVLMSFNGVNVDVFVYNTVFGYFLLIFKEFVVGYLIGYMSYFIFNCLLLTGQITDQQLGYSMANMFDPVNQIQVSITGNLYYFTLLTLFFILGGHYFIIRCLFYSYEAISIGAVNIVGNKNLFEIMIKLIAKFFLLGYSIALPIVGVILVMEVALGVLSKSIPKMNMLVIGMPAKVIIGVSCIWIIIPTFSSIYYLLNEVISKFTLDIIRIIMQ